MTRTVKYFLAILVCYATGFVGSLFIGANVDQWYAHLVKPALTPPNFVFPIVWLVLYLLMGIAAGRLWCKTSLWHPWIGGFLFSLAFNAAWTMFFFGFHVVWLALIDAICLGVIATALVLGAWEIDRRAAYLMTPYALWILFAIYLNASIWLLS